MRSGVLSAAVAALALLAAAGLSSGQAAAAAPGAHDGPFGLYIGEPLADVGPTRPADSGALQVLQPPIPNENFSEIAVYASESNDVCLIEATTDDFAGDTDASQARALADRLSASLTEKYGDVSQKDDSCAGQGADCYADFAARLADKQASYRYRWAPATATASGVTSVILGVFAGDDSTRVTLIYFGPGGLQCFQATTAKSTGAGL